MSEPTCCITGHVAGHPDTCDDCDPCFAAWRVSPEVKRLIAEIIEWRAKYEAAICELDDLAARENNNG